MYSKPEIAPIKKVVKPKHYPKNPKGKTTKASANPNPKAYGGAY